MLFFKSVLHFRRNRFAAHSIFCQRVSHRPHSFFGAFRRQLLPFIKLVFHLETASPPVTNSRLNCHNFPKRRRSIKLRAGVNHRNPQQSIRFQHCRLPESRLFKKRVGARIEIFKKSRKVHDPRRIAIAPLHLYLFPVAQHFLVSPAIPWSLLYPAPLAESVFLAASSHLHSYHASLGRLLPLSLRRTSL